MTSDFINSIFTSSGNFAVTAGILFGGAWIAHYGIMHIIWCSIIGLAFAVMMVLIKKKYAETKL